MSLTEDWKDGKLLKCERYWVKSPVFIGAKPAFLNSVSIPLLVKVRNDDKNRNNMANPC